MMAVAPFAIATVVGLVILWPSSDPLESGAQQGSGAERFKATVSEVTESDCEQVAQGRNFECVEVVADVADRDTDATFTFSRSAGTRAIEVGDRIIVSRPPPPPEGTQVPGAPPPPEFYFVDFERGRPLVILAAIFAIAVVALSRWRGLAALVGLALSILILTRFVLPAILEGSSPLAVSIVGAAAIMFAALYMAHGLNARTTTAVLGTLASLTVTAVLSLIFGKSVV